MKEKGEGKKRKSVFIGVAVALLLVIVGVTMFSRGGESDLKKKLELANQYITEGKYEEAVLAFEAVLAIDENSVEARVGLSQACIKLEDYAKAEEVLRQGLALDKTQTALWDSLLAVCEVSGRSTEELAALVKEAFEATGNEKYKETQNAESETNTNSEAEGETTEGEEVLESGMIPLEDPEKVIEFVDPVFEQAVRALYELGDGDIRWKDVGYQTEMKFSDDEENARVQNVLLDEEISTLEDLKWFVNLKDIDMNNLPVSGDIAVLSRLSNLKQFDLGFTQVRGDIVAFSGLSNLQVVFLSATQVSGDLASLSGLSNLYNLNMYNTNVTGTVTLSNGCVVTVGEY